jgi:hypothetical protein
MNSSNYYDYSTLRHYLGRAMQKFIRISHILLNLYDRLLLISISTAHLF